MTVRRIHWPIAKRALLAWLWAMLFMCGTTLAAEDAFEIRSATLLPREGVYLLSAKLHFTLAEGARQAIVDGVPLTLEVQLELQRARRWWLDESIATITQRYEIVFHALSEQYLLRNLNSGAQNNYATLDAALDALSSIRDLPVLDVALLDTAQQYEARLRASLDIRTLPDTLRMVLFWTDDWRQRTEWYVWPLKQ